MTLPATPPISLAQVCTEFGAPPNTPLGSFRRGGAWVPNTPQNAGVPTGLPISLGQLCGAAKTTTLSVTAPNTSGDSGTGVNAIFGSSTATPSGGVAPYTYLWTQVSGGTFTIDSPTAQSTNFRRAGNPPTPSPTSGTYRVTVTDSIGGNAFKDITVTDNRS